MNEEKGSASDRLQQQAGIVLKKTEQSTTAAGDIDI
jgi:hypothetical protein